jgi:LacI family transcriptional regulator
MSDRTPTLTDVARAAGVHFSTVSRVMNPATRHKVSDEVAKRILAEAKRIGYRTNQAASTLRTRRSNIVGVVLPDITNAVFPPILLGIEEGLRKEGYLAIVVNVGFALKEYRFVIERLLRQQVDGLIIAAARRQDPMIKHCVQQGLPVVAVNRSEETGLASSVANDEMAGMRLAVEHLVKLGHKRIAHVAGPETISTGHLRRLGFLWAVEEMKLAGDRCQVVEGAAYSREAGRQACLELFALPGKRATAVVAGNDLLALGCYDALRELGLSCPADVSIIGHNDMPLIDMLAPPLTSLRIQHREMGRQAARLLLNHLQQPDMAPVRITLAPELMVRKSTASPRKKNQ